MADETKIPWTRLDACRVQVGPVPGMRVPGIVYADEPMMEQLAGDMALSQVARAARCGCRGNLEELGEETSELSPPDRA